MFTQDSAGKPIKVGDRVRFRGGIYTIKAFRPGAGRGGCNALDFEEDVTGPHASEVPDEIGVDRVLTVTD